MKSKDEILKYLSELMTENEKASFEKELASSDELKNELARYKNFLSGLNISNEIPDDSHYFQNLLPKVRMKLDKQKSRKWIPQFGYLIPTATAVFLILMNTGKFNDNKKAEQADKKTDSSLVVNSNSENIESDNQLVTDFETYELEKKQSISFEVGIKDISNKEHIKEMIEDQPKIPYMEDYLLALK